MELTGNQVELTGNQVELTGNQVRDMMGAEFCGAAEKFVLAKGTTLESFIMALDLEDPRMDRGMIRCGERGQMTVWEWREHLSGLAVETAMAQTRHMGSAAWAQFESFCVGAMGLLAEWMTGRRFLQDTLLTVVPLSTVPLSRLSAGTPLQLFSRGMWRAADAVLAIVGGAGFHKDDVAVSRTTFGCFPPEAGRGCEEELRRALEGGGMQVGAILAQWLAVLAELERGRLGRAELGLSSPFLEEWGRKEYNGPLIDPVLSNCFGVGCPRRTGAAVAGGTATGQARQLVDEFNGQLGRARAALLGLQSDGHGYRAVAGTLAGLSDCFQVIRAALVRALFASGCGALRIDAPLFQDRPYGEYRAVCDLCHILLHAPSRQWRLIPDWLQGLHSQAGDEDHGPFSRALVDLVGFAKEHWLGLGHALRLFSTPLEQDEARAWTEALRQGQEDGRRQWQDDPRWQHRWAPLLLLAGRARSGSL